MSDDAYSRAVDAMWPARWVDAWCCDQCGVELGAEDAHWPHEPDCPQKMWDSQMCGCDRLACSACCPDCATVESHWLLLAFVALMVLLSCAQLVVLANRLG